MAPRSVLLVYFFQIFFVSLLSLTQTGLGFPVSQAVPFLSWHSSSPLLFLADSGQLSGLPLCNAATGVSGWRNPGE